MINALFTILYHDIRANIHEAFTWVTPLFFYIMMVCLFPLALGPENTVLIKLAPGIVWVAALTAIVLSINTLFRSEWESGHLDLLLLSPHPLTLIVLSKLIAHWLTTVLPLVIVTPLLGVLLQLNLTQIHGLLFTLLLGTPVLCLIGGIGAALTVGIKGSGLLLPILILPLYIPVLIVSTSCVTATVNHQSVSGYIAILGALILLSVSFAPYCTAAALRIGVNQ